MGSQMPQDLPVIKSLRNYGCLTRVDRTIRDGEIVIIAGVV